MTQTAPFSIPGLSASQVSLLEAKVKATGTPLGKLIQHQGVQGVVHDAAFQAIRRLVERDEIPPQIVEEAAAWATQEEASRTANTAGH